MCLESPLLCRNRVQVLTYTPVTCEHHDVLEVGADAAGAAEVEQEGQRVNVGGPAQENSQLGGEAVKDTTPALKKYLSVCVSFLA